MNSTSEKNLLSFFEQLNENDQVSVLCFAEFLAVKSTLKPKVQAVKERPLAIDRPETESVVVAIKRLSKTYPMINKSGVLDQAAKLMTDHMLYGKQANLVIDELESVFLLKYEQYCQSIAAKNNSANNNGVS